ncbi:MAG TPA: response regulator [Vicinamibacterales bacterium]|nr:response regulator [Vicinamibacterales bacterium]
MRRVLVVDDHQDGADSLGLMLELLGATTRVVYDGQSALQAIDEFLPEVVFLDIGMPLMDGYDVARAIRQRPEHRGIHLVALTGWGRDDDRRRSLEAGFDRHLVKPLDPAALKDVLGE